MEQRRTGVIIVAGGAGRRAGGALPKQFRIVGNLPVLGHAINAFARALPEAPIVVVLAPEWHDLWHDLAARFRIARHRCTAGGAERFHSVRNGLDALPIDVSLVAVHDGARPLVSEELIRRCVACAAAHDSAVPAVAAVDSMRQLDAGGTSRPVDRSALRCVQTPQVFDAALLREAYTTEYRPEFTDDASVFERAGHSVTLCEGERNNLKITVAEDLLIAGALLDPNDNGREENL